MPLRSGIIRSSRTMIVTRFVELMEAIAAVDSEFDDVALHFEKRFQAFPDIGFVVDYKDSAFGGVDQTFTGLSGERKLQMKQCTSAGLALHFDGRRHAPERFRKSLINLDQCLCALPSL